MRTPTSAVETIPSSDTQSISLDAPAGDVFAFIADPINLPLWAVGFCRSIRHDPADQSRWLVKTAHGDIPLRISADPTFGVIDFHMEVAPGVMATAFSRLLPIENGSIYVFTQTQLAGMSDEIFRGQVAALTDELHVLQRIMHARASCPTAVASGRETQTAAA